MAKGPDVGDAIADPTATNSPLRALFEPRSIAVAGASDRTGSIGGSVFRALAADRPGRVHPVNPRQATVAGVPAVASVADLRGEPIDLLIAAVRAEEVATAVEQAGEIGAGAAIVLTSGFGEVAEGVDLDRALAEARRRTGVRVLGPNCLGLLSIPDNLRATFMNLDSVVQQPGPVAIVAQSGAVGGQIFRKAQSDGLGVSQLVMVGNESDITVGEVTTHLLGRSDVKVVLVFIEGVRDAAALLSAGLRSLELGKPIILMKVGRNERSNLAAASHTGSLAVPDVALDAALERAGIIRVHSVRRMINYAKCFAFAPTPEGRDIAILSGSGGLGVLMADEAVDHGLCVAVPEDATRAELVAAMPWFGSAHNPIDFTGNIVADPSKLRRVFDITFAAPEFDAICVAGTGRGIWEPIRDAVLANRASGRSALVYSELPDIARQLLDVGIAAVDDAADLMSAFADMATFRERGAGRVDARFLDAVGRPSVGTATTWAPSAAQGLLEAAGITFLESIRVTRAGDVGTAVASLGTPVVIKLDAPWVPHKTEKGGVALNVTSIAEAVDVAARLFAVADAEAGASDTGAALIVQPMITPEIEVFVGASRDAMFGPLVSVGLGGRLVEVLAERASTLCPVPPELADAMVARLCGGRLADSARGLSSAAAATLARAITAVASVMSERPEITEVDVNPIAFVGDVGYALDALVVEAR